MPPRYPFKRRREVALDNAETRADERRSRTAQYEQKKQKKDENPGSGWTDFSEVRGIPSCPPSTLSLAFSSLPPPTKPSNGYRRPVLSLLSLAARKVALGMDEYQLDHFRQGRLSTEAAQEVVRALARRDQGWKVDLGNWVAMGVEFGEKVMDTLPAVDEDTLSTVPSFFNPTLARKAVELINTPRHRHVPVELLELTAGLSSQPATSPLLSLVGPLARTAPMNLLVSLSLAGSDFRDENASCLRGLKFLISLDLSRTRATDMTTKALASALYVSPGSGEERRGLWQLQAWSFRACGGIGDRSATSLRQFPLLTYIDVRETSATFPAFALLLKPSSSTSPPWTPLPTPPPTSLHTHLHPPNSSQLTLLVHTPVRPSLAPLPTLPSRTTTAYITAPFIRSLPLNPLAPPPPLPKLKQAANRTNELEPARLKKKKKTGGADEWTRMLFSTSSSSSSPSVTTKPPKLSKSSSTALLSSSPAAPYTNPFGSSSPGKSPPPTVSARRPKPIDLDSDSDDSYVQIMEFMPPPRLSSPRPVRRTGTSHNPFAVKTSSSSSKPSSGGGTVFVKRVVEEKLPTAGKKGKGAGGFAPRPKERKAVGEGTRALDGTRSFFFPKKGGG